MNNSKISIVIPTYNRVEKLNRCISSILGSTYQNFEICVIADNCCSNTEGFINKYPLSIGSRVELLVNDKQSRAFGCWNKFLRNHFKEDIFCFLCDDTELKPDCLENAVKEFEDLDLFLGFNQVNLPSSTKYAMGLVGRDFVNRFPNKEIFCPIYNCFYADEELYLYANAINKFKYGETAHIIHYHPAFYKDELDETHAVVRSPKLVNEDRQNFNKRKKDGLIYNLER